MWHIYYNVTVSPISATHLWSVNTPLLSKDRSLVLRPSCVHTLWFCKDTSQCTDGVSHVWLGLVLQCCLCPLFCLASFVAPDLSHRTTELFITCFLIIGASWSVNIWKTTCTMLTVAVLCACMSQTESRLKVKRERFHSHFCNKASAIKFFLNLLRRRLLSN